MGIDDAILSAAITLLAADSGVQATALGATPRIYTSVPPGAAFPFLILRSEHRNDDTHDARCNEVELTVYVEGEYEGVTQGNAILTAVKTALRAWAPASLSGHTLENLVFTSQAVTVGEDGKRYAGVQLWRAATQEV